MRNSKKSHKDPHWIWGIFYYNKDDQRIFPPKRQQWMGWTVNFANWKSVFAFLLMIAFFSGLIWMIEANR